MIITHQKYEKERIREEIIFAEREAGHKLSDREIAFYDEKVALFSEKPQQIARALPEETIGQDCVQSFISNMSAPTSLEELAYTDGLTLPENLMSAPTNEWTAPKWAKAGDVVFFMHSKTARSSLTALRSELTSRKADFTALDYNRLLGWLDHALDIHAQYGGKIFAVGRVCGGPEYAETDSLLESILHWRSRNYSAIDNILILEHPLDISSFREYIYISRGSATTPLFDKEFSHLRCDISKENALPAYVMDAVARPLPLRTINKDNWIEVSNDYRRCFILEKQFRQFYVDYLLRDIGDQKRFFTECRCQRADINDSFMDYVMLFNGKYIPVEVKLAVSAEPNIIGQVSKYVHNSRVFLTDDGSRCAAEPDFHNGKVLVIDTDKLYMYDATTNSVIEIYDLGQLTSKGELQAVKRAIASHL
ncbi:MAG: hypothetical protein J6A79_10035 [Clostridia bacterium]|nr:hypothetical protein [Clostridia bacterium]